MNCWLCIRTLFKAWSLADLIQFGLMRSTSWGHMKCSSALGPTIPQECVSSCWVTGRTSTENVEKVCWSFHAVSAWSNVAGITGVFFPAKESPASFPSQTPLLQPLSTTLDSLWAPSQIHKSPFLPGQYHEWEIQLAPWHSCSLVPPRAPVKCQQHCCSASLCLKFARAKK